MEWSETHSPAAYQPQSTPRIVFKPGDAPLETIIANEVLDTRPWREPDYKAENEALVLLAATLADASHNVLNQLVTCAQRLCQAHSAGISLAEEESGQPIFRWHAISGHLAPFLGGTMPRHSSPCGEVLRRQAPQLMQHPSRHYPLIETLQTDLHEVLLVPFQSGPDFTGTLWVVAHDNSKQFDSEDLRLMQSLSKFAATAVLTLHNLKNLQETSQRLNDIQLRMETALSVGDIATWLWDYETRMVHADRNLARLFGVSPDAAPGHALDHYVNAIHPDDRTRVCRALDEARHTPTAVEIEFRIQAPEFPLRWVESRGRLVIDPISKKPLLTGVVVDISERRRIEDQLRIQSEQLAEASQRKDEFLATLSHELRSPLNIIQGHTELLRFEEPGTPEFEDSLDAIERSAKLQTQLIADMLDVSRIIAGKMMLDITVSDPQEIITDAIQAIQYAADARSIALVCDIQQPCGMINGDRGRIQQALWNYLANAVKFSKAGGQVIIQVRRSKSSIEFRVIDHGQGISPEFLPYVFDRFHQEDGSRSRKYGGLGLGLAIVRHIAELHGGTVRAESAGKDRGSTFVLSIPVVALVDNLQVSRASTPEPESMLPAEDNTVQLADCRILVVDDQMEAASLLKRSLERLGAQVMTANTAENAWRHLESLVFDILISDIGMPDVNGFDLIKTWRSQEASRQRSPIPAIALTAYATENDRLEILAAGFTAHLAKPAGLRELAATILTEIGVRP